LRGGGKSEADAARKLIKTGIGIRFWDDCFAKKKWLGLAQEEGKSLKHRGDLNFLLKKSYGGDKA